MYELGHHRRQLEATDRTGQGTVGKLTGDDLSQIAGRRDQLAGKIQERYGVAKEEAEQQMQDWVAKADDTWLK